MSELFACSSVCLSPFLRQAALRRECLRLVISVRFVTQYGPPFVVVSQIEQSLMSICLAESQISSLQIHFRFDHSVLCISLLKSVSSSHLPPRSQLKRFHTFFVIGLSFKPTVQDACQTFVNVQPKIAFQVCTRKRIVVEDEGHSFQGSILLGWNHANLIQQFRCELQNIKSANRKSLSLRGSFEVARERWRRSEKLKRAYRLEADLHLFSTIEISLEFALQLS